jgi:Raf kinase inhibitor-like YbhB/YbcL family protein
MGGSGGANGGSGGGKGGAGGTAAGAGGKGGSSQGGAGGTIGGGGAGGSGGSTGAMTLTSPDHTEGAKFADAYTCALKGFNGSIMPELHWTPGPTGTKSYALTFIDVTLADKGQANGYHWVLYNIPPTTTELPEAFKDAASIGAKQNSNFLGPCPNFGGGSANTDTYEFTLYALKTETITISGSGTAAVQDADMKLEADNLAKAKLTGTSNAAPP